MTGRIVRTGLAALLLLPILLAGCEVEQERGGWVEMEPAVTRQLEDATIQPAADLKVSGPFQHENLAIYLVHGGDTVAGQDFLTLDEAIDKKVLVVHETEEVNELTLDNRSETESIFIQGGEIVSGGKQDRCLAVDVVLPPKAKGVTIDSFCVESGRWTGRSGQSVEVFDTKSNLAPTRKFKMAMRVQKDQGAVWDEVKRSQGRLRSNVAGLSYEKLSPTSLDATLDDPKLKEAIQQYADALASCIEGKSDVVGFAFAVNGKLSSADVYGSKALFRKLWPKMLKASAVEAVSERDRAKDTKAPAVEEVTTWVTAVRKGKAERRSLAADIGLRMNAMQMETDRDVLYELFDESASMTIHRGYLRKDDGDRPAPTPSPAPPEPAAER